MHAEREELTMAGAIYEFNENDIVRFAQHIGMQFRKRGSEYHFLHCPYCHGADKNTFSINAVTGQFKCLRSSCGATGNMITLAKDFDFSLGDDYDRYSGRRDTEFKRFKLAHVQSKDRAVEYCKSRGISEAICRKYELTTQNGNESILCFPFRDENNVAWFFKYRNMDFKKGETQGAKEWCQKDCKPILFGMNHCEGFDRLIVTEGQLDSLSVATAGIPNAVSVPTGCNGATWIPHCWNFLIRFKELIIFGDCENGHITLVDMLAKRFPNKVRVVRMEDYKGCKDANDILRTYGSEQIHACIDNAETLPVRGIKKLSEVTPIRFQDLEVVPTGYADIDKVLGGGLFFGQVIVLTGKRGDGKSTFLNQICCNVIDYGIKSLIYSGELSEFNIKRNFDSQLSGFDEREMYESRHAADINKLVEWYSNRLFYYDSSDIDGDENEHLLEYIELAIKQEGIRFVAIDNLMTVVNAESNEKLYRQQSSFVGKIVKMAKTYNIIVVLVAHPRKGQNGEFDNDEVMGSSEITNRVDVVMNYSRIKAKNGEEVNEDLRDLTIAKNRLFGTLAIGNKAIRLAYCRTNRRIDQLNGGTIFSRQYGWKNDGFEAAEQIELPW